MSPLYFDHNATTPLREDVREHYFGWLAEGLGNPSSLHGAGRRARLLIDEARERAAAALGVHEDELLFTSGGTESNNIALRGAALATNGGVAALAIEHAAVLEPAAALSRDGLPPLLLGHDSVGHADPEAIRAAAGRPDVGVLSIGAANGEVGTVQDLSACVAAARGAGSVLFHTDAVQAVGRVPLDLRGSGVDLASVSAHKLGGPVGVGLLYIRSGVQIAPSFHGGGQEGGMRPGTENAAAIAAASLAIARAVEERDEYAQRCGAMLAELERDLESAIPQLVVNSPSTGVLRLPNTLNVTLPNVDGRVVVTRLDLEGLRVSSGSACASGSLEPSHVLRSLGLETDRARASIRLSLGRTTAPQECRQVVEILRKICA